MLTLKNGDHLPPLGLGTWKSNPGEVGQAVTTAISLGYRHIDCAPIYGNEAEIGLALESAVKSNTVSRADLWITSKLWNNRHLKQDVIPALKKTLADLRLDYLDLFLIHWPIAIRPEVHFPEKGEDFLTPGEAPLEETWAAMEQAVAQGLTRHIGVSNFSPTRLRNLIATSSIAPEVNQVESHPLLAQRELMDISTKHGVILTAYSPLGSPDRPARLHRGDDPAMLENPIITTLAAARSITPAQLILAWAVTRGTSVIPKSVNPRRLAENLAAATITLTPQEMETLAGLDQSYRFVDGSVWAMPGSPYSVEWLWNR